MSEFGTGGSNDRFSDAAATSSLQGPHTGLKESVPTCLHVHAASSCLVAVCVVDTEVVSQQQRRKTLCCCTVPADQLFGQAL